MIFGAFVTDFSEMQRTLNEAATAVAARENERTPLLGRDRRRSSTLDARSDTITVSLQDDDNDSSDLPCSSSPSTSPSSLSSRRGSRAPDTPKHKRRQQHSPSRPSSHETPCKSQHIAANRQPFSASLQAAHRHGIMRAGIPLDRKCRAALQPPSPRAGRFVIKGTYHRAYQTIEYERPVRPWVQRDLEAQRDGDLGDEVDAMMEVDSCFYWMVVIARGCLMVLVSVGVIVLLLLMFAYVMGSFDQ